VAAEPAPEWIVAATERQEAARLVFERRSVEL
jgi:hypothetical protein